MVTGTVFSVVTLGFGGQTTYHHYAGMWAADKNGAVNHKVAYDGAPHQEKEGCHNTNKSGKSAAYW